MFEVRVDGVGDQDAGDDLVADCGDGDTDLGQSQVFEKFRRLTKGVDLRWASRSNHPAAPAGSARRRR